MDDLKILDKLINNEQVTLQEIEGIKDKEVLKGVTKFFLQLYEHTALISIQMKLQEEKDKALIQKLSEELKNLRTRVFNSRQEKLIKKSKPKVNKKRNLPHNQSPSDYLEDEVELSEEVKTYELEACSCPDCGGELEFMNSYEESSEIDVIPAKYIVRRHMRKKYNCKGCHKFVTAQGGIKLTPGGEYGIDLAANIVTDKFEDHIPLERQRKRLHQGGGIKVDVKTLYNLTEHIFNRLSPLSEMIRTEVIENKWVHLDESPVNFYNPKKSRGYMWSMSSPTGVFYQFEPTRSGAVAKEMLRGFKNGIVMTDSFSGYNFLNKEDNIKHAYCWAHVRRKFFEAITHDKRAEEVVRLIDKLYEIEHEANSLDDLPELRIQSKKIVEEIDEWISSMDGKFLKSSSLGKAIFYYESQRDGLILFLKDKNIPIDNNAAERSQRAPVMGRKNYLHFKSINGADLGSFFYTIIQSAKLNKINANLYIKEMVYRAAIGEEIKTPSKYRDELQKIQSEELKGLKESLLKAPD